MILGGAVSLFYKDAVMFKLDARVFRLEKGFSWKRKVVDGSFEDFIGIEIKRFVSRVGSPRNFSFVTLLKVKNMDEALKLANSITMERAKNEAQDYAELFNIKIIENNSLT